MKKQLMRIISFTLIISIILTIIPIVPVAASAELYIRTSVTTLTANTESEREQAAIEVTLSGYTWAYNYFHNQVQDHIRGNNFDFLENELQVYYKDENGNQTGEWGWVDLSVEIDPYTYMWEVKPVHYGLNPVLEQKALEEQLDKYIATNDNYKRGNESGFTIPMGTFISKEEKYKITYEDAGNGLILYRFDRNDNDDDEDNKDDIDIPIIVPDEDDKDNHDDKNEDDKEKESSNDNNHIGFVPKPGEEEPEKEDESKVAISPNAKNEKIIIIDKNVNVESKDITVILSPDFNFELNGINLPKDWVNSQNDRDIAYSPKFSNIDPDVATRLLTVAAAVVCGGIISMDTASKSLSQSCALFLAGDVSAYDFMVVLDTYSNIIDDEFYERAKNDYEDIAIDYIDDFPDLCNKLGIDENTPIDELQDILSDYLKNNASLAEDGLNDAKDIRVTDPLIIDLDGSGIETISLSNGVYFDHQGNGFMIKTGWVGSASGLLVRDINNDGIIDVSGRNLFGNHTLLKNGKEAVNGFEALKDLDDNKDGVFDEKDTSWNEVFVWIDNNSNGKTDEGELITLEQADIVSFNLDYEEIFVIDSHGNVHRQVSAYTKSDGTIADIVDVWFARDAKDSIAKSNIPESDEVRALPDIRGFGKAYSLHQAMMRDGSGQLQSLVEQFIVEKNENVRMNLVTQIMYKWTGTNSNLSALEVITGEKYTGNTNSNAMAVINRTFDNFAKSIYEYLMAQTHLKDLYSKMIPMGTEDDYHFNLSYVAYEILCAISIDEAQGERLLVDFVKNMYALTMLEWVDVDGFRDSLATASKRYGLILDAAVGKNIIYGTNGNDKLKGANSGNIYWVEKGNNTIDGGLGDNTYFLGKDFGTNTITDEGGNNTILLMNSVDQSNIQINRVLNTGNVEITVSDGTGKIIIKDYNLKANYSLIFPDGSICDLQDLLGWTEINSVEDFITIQNDLYQNYRLMSDLDFNGITWQPIGKNTSPFYGIFDGNGYSINNLNINLATQDYVGLFGYSKGAIINLSLTNASVTGRNYAGAIAGYNNGTAINCTVSKSTVKGISYVGGFAGFSSGALTDCSATETEINGTSNYAGGFIGYNSGAMTNCTVSVNDVKVTASYVGGFTGFNSGIMTDCIITSETIGVSGSSNVGGFVGVNSGTIKNSEHYTLTVTGVSGGSYVGGFVGQNSGTLTEFSVTGEGTVKGTSSNVGGFVGKNSGSITKSYTPISVQGASYVGGFVGYTSNGLIEQCYSTGDVTSSGSYCGGFVGYHTGSTAVIRNSYSLGNASNVSSSGGFAGAVSAATAKIENCYTTANHANGFSGNTMGTYVNSYFDSSRSPSKNTNGRTSAEMAKTETYADWNFESIWAIEDSYPTLQGLAAIGKDTDTKEIRTIEDLDSIKNDLLGSYRLMNNLDLSGTEWQPIGTNTAPFTGIFDGNGFTISNLNINKTTLDYVGLFGYSIGRIENVNLTNASVTGRNYAGAIAGYNNGTAINCTVSKSTVKGSSYVGGFAGFSSGALTDCQLNSIELIGSSYVGGITGQSTGTVKDCSATIITTKGNGTSINGLVGHNTGSVINATLTGWNSQN